MVKSKTPALPHWVNNLRRMMDAQGFNPRSLSLKAGLNATAVRDMLEGRSRFPRYDTTLALAEALNTTPALLMSDPKNAGEEETSNTMSGGDLELLTEIIARLQETTEELNRKLSPRDFAAMTAAIYRRIQESEERKTSSGFVRSQVHDLLNYELLKQKRARR